MPSDNKPYIELKIDGETHRTTLAHDEMFADELIDKFCRLLVCAGYPPTVLNIDDEDGRWLWLHNDEQIVPKESEEQVKNGTDDSTHQD